MITPSLIKTTLQPSEEVKLHIKNRKKICILGNPNCGKSTLFNVMTCSREAVGNWSGVTIEKKIGYASIQNIEVEFIDLPGIYALNLGHTTDTPEDEKVVFDFLSRAKYDLIINVLDVTYLKRGLYLTLQLLEMQKPLLVILNMMDLVYTRGLHIDQEYLSANLKQPVVLISAKKKHGIDHLKKTIIQSLSTHSSSMRMSRSHKIPNLDTKEEHRNANSGIVTKYSSAIESQTGSHIKNFYHYYPEIIKEGIVVIQNALQQISNPQHIICSHWLALRALEDGSEILDNNNVIIRFLTRKYQNLIQKTYQEDHELVFIDARYKYIESLMKNAIQKPGILTKTRSDIIDNILLNKVVGLPIFFSLMYLMFTFSIVVGGAFQDFFNLSAGAVFVDGTQYLLEQLGIASWMITIIATGIGGGIQAIAPFIPVIGGLYLFLSFLEESGYITRAAFLMDKFMQKIGLPGQAFVPLIIGFGCNVPAIMATRTLENKQARIATIMIAPFISCSARLSVFALFCAAFFPHNGQNIVFMLYLMGITVGLLTGYIVTKTLGHNKQSHFIMELPEYHLPSFSGILIKTYDKLKNFIFGAGKLIVIVFLVIKLLNVFALDGSTGHENKNSSILAVIGQNIVPIFKPMGIDHGNWPAAVGIFTGLFAKEVVVGTLNALYLPLDQSHSKQPKEFLLFSDLKMAVMTIPNNFITIAERLYNPLWLNMPDFNTQEAFLRDNQLNRNITGALQERFDGTIGAVAYLLFILLYFPCISVFAVICQEIGKKWAILNSIWSTAIAYSVSVLFYQTSKCIMGEPYSLASIAIACIVFLIAYILLKFLSMSGKSISNFFSYILRYKDCSRTEHD